MMERPRSFMEISSSHSSRRDDGSIPLVGSSKNTSGASPINDVATHSRRFCPPLSWSHRAWVFSVSPRDCNSSGISVSGSRDPRTAQKSTMCSRTVSSGYIGLSCGQIARFHLTRSISFSTDAPITYALPEVIGIIPVRQLIAVLFPAPLCPSSAKSSPLRTDRLIWSTALNCLPPRLNSLLMARISSTLLGSMASEAASVLPTRRRRGHMYEGRKQKVLGLAAPKSPW
mmetsp:Transcript_54289/g.118999  ORF Transcript_54289/g.118999 Transcript_54289/m.118999 type:complete len:229 (+) Transcript_54289:2534-3220(+)